MTPAKRARAERVRGWIFWPALAALVFFVPWPARLVDQAYSRGAYPWVQRALTGASNLVPLAVMDLLLGALALGVLIRLILLARSAQQRGFGSATWEGTRRIVRAVGVVVVLFVSAWGCNYRRTPLEASLGRGGEQATNIAALRAAIVDADALGSRLRARANSAAAPDFDVLAQRLLPHMNAALTTLGFTPLAHGGRPKFSIILSPFFTRAGVDGMVNPFALESLIAPELLPFERASVLAHEWGHLAGLADEAEASAVGWFACMQGPPELAYSAALYLILESLAALPAAERREAWTSLHADVRTDLEAISRRLQRRQPQVQRAASQVYDRYLKANRVADGNASYSRALRLILAEPLRGALTKYKAPRK